MSITNRDLVKFGRQLEEERDINRRVHLMSRIAIIRENIRRDQCVLLELEGELAVENEKYRARCQTRLAL